MSGCREEVRTAGRLTETDAGPPRTPDTETEVELHETWEDTKGDRHGAVFEAK